VGVVSSQVSFADINQALSDTESGTCVKAVLRMPTV
jgi:hypothetical protein